MWKIVAFVLAIFILGHFAVRYVRKNPLDPVIDGSQVVVESQDYQVRFQRNGAVSGTYFVANATSEDWTNRPVNLRLAVYGLQTGGEYTRGYPDFHLYGTSSSERLLNVAMPLSLIAANRGAYGALRALFDRHERRASEGGERLCVTLSGEAMSIESAESLEDGHDVTETLGRANIDEPIVFVDQLEFDDCTDLLARKR